MPEWAEYCYFARYLCYLSQFIGPIFSTDQRVWPSGVQANRSPTFQGTTANEALRLHFCGEQFHVSWYPKAKWLCAVMTSISGGQQQQQGWLKVCLATGGYPQLVVSSLLSEDYY